MVGCSQEPGTCVQAPLTAGFQVPLLIPHHVPSIQVRGILMVCGMGFLSSGTSSRVGKQPSELILSRVA